MKARKHWHMEEKNDSIGKKVIYNVYTILLLEHVEVSLLVLGSHHVVFLLILPWHGPSTAYFDPRL